MSARQPSVQGSLTVLTAAQADRIARLFAKGQPAGRIALIARCTRARVAQVAAQHGWTLDAAGVLPRQQRPAVTPGQPIPAVGSGLAAARPAGLLPPLPPTPTGQARPAPAPRTGPPCSRPDCGNHARTRGLCSKHYMRERRAAAAS